MITVTRTAEYAKGKRGGSVLAAVLAVVAVALLCGTVFAAEAPAEDANMFDNVLAQVKAVSMDQVDRIHRMSLYLFASLALVSFMWMLYNALFAEPELGGFFHNFMYWLLVTGCWLFLVNNGPGILYTVVESFQEMAGDTGEIKPGDVTAQGVIAFETLVDTIQWPGIWDVIWDSQEELLAAGIEGIMTVILGFCILLMTVYIGVCLTLLLINAYILVYTGYFYFSFAGLEWTRQIAQNYLRSVLMVGSELVATLMCFLLFSKVFTDLIAAFVVSAANTESGVFMRDILVIFVALVMCTYFVSAVPKVLAKSVAGVATGIAVPVSYRNIKAAANLTASAAILVSKKAAGVAGKIAGGPVAGVAVGAAAEASVKVAGEAARKTANAVADVAGRMSEK